MFIAIFLPVAHDNKSVLAVVLIAAACSMVFEFLLTFVSGGFAVIISALVASVIGAIFFPVDEEEGS